MTNKRTLHVIPKDRWWVGPFVGCAMTFFFSMRWAFDDESEAAFIENVSRFIAYHGVRYVIKEGRADG